MQDSKKALPFITRMILSKPSRSHDGPKSYQNMYGEQGSLLKLSMINLDG